jgi:hypothetical protein
MSRCITHTRPCTEVKQKPSGRRGLGAEATQPEPVQIFEVTLCRSEGDRVWPILTTPYEAASPPHRPRARVAQCRSVRRFAPEYIDLVAKNQDLRFTPCAGPQQPNERITKQPEQLKHRPRASPDSRRFARYRVSDKDSQLPCPLLAPLRHADGRLACLLSGELRLSARAEIAPEVTGHGLPLSKCEAYKRVYAQPYGSS